MNTWPGATIAVMRSSRFATLLRRETTVTRSCERSLSRFASMGFISSHALRNHLVEHVDLHGFGAGVPVFDSSAGVEDEVILFVGLLDRKSTRLNSSHLG